jgi:peroxiredoxin
VNQEPRAIRVGDAMPTVRLKTGAGESVDLSVWHGRPLVVVCVRYYG